MPNFNDSLLTVERMSPISKAHSGNVPDVHVRGALQSSYKWFTKMQITHVNKTKVCWNNSLCELLLWKESNPCAFRKWNKPYSCSPHCTMTAVNLTELSLPQLEGLKNQLEQVYPLIPLPYCIIVLLWLITLSRLSVIPGNVWCLDCPS